MTLRSFYEHHSHKTPSIFEILKKKSIFWVWEYPLCHKFTHITFVMSSVGGLLDSIASIYRKKKLALSRKKVPKENFTRVCARTHRERECYLSYKNFCSQGICIPRVKYKVRRCVSCKGHLRRQYSVCNLTKKELQIQRNIRKKIGYITQNTNTSM